MPLQGVPDANARHPSRGGAGGGRQGHTPARLRCPRPAAPSGLRPAPALGPGLPPRPRTVCDCRLWLASTAAVSGTVSSSSTLPAGGFSMKAIPGRRRRRRLSSRTRNRRRRAPPPAASRRRCCQRAPPHAPPPPAGS